ncbi:alanine racemase [Olsenella sp. HMSC062G07]|uniref:alanine racemase n=1 Tax=Olsenella sp. HMSC062G07 TaxID=1739330 RepID=UPI0008A610D6|nr:alanine racemase [Olsenella sp. HMSC062G07]OFK23652.1 amino-acid racemase [Olsenella sp. HMSC062G07]
MLLDRLLKTNRPLAELALSWQRDGALLPDTYLIDLDALTQNAEAIKATADSRGIRLYYMLKQLGRNPLVGRRLAELGYDGAVCVDFRETLAMIEAHLPLGNVGHLVQVPRAAMARIVAARPQIMTVYSVEKAAQIGAEAEHQGFVQPIMLRVLGPHDMLYQGQYGGFELDGLDAALCALEKIEGVRVAGVCSFPCLLYSEASGKIEPTPNVQTVLEAATLLGERGYCDLQINMPSVSCVEAVGVVAALGGTHMEPGHGLTGTTPWHAAAGIDVPERVAYAYVSEVSHNLGGRSYCYAGGHYRRGHAANALVGTNLAAARRMGVGVPPAECIDYHFELSEPAPVGDPVLMCFRTQMFVTRSEVAVVSGLSSGAPALEGIFDVQGHRLR